VGGVGSIIGGGFEVGDVKEAREAEMRDVGKRGDERAWSNRLGAEVWSGERSWAANV
jgi:hypothetical protein